MSRGAYVGLLSLVIALALVYYLAKDQATTVGRRGAEAPVGVASAAKCIANQRTLESVIAMYRMTHDGENPTTLSDLVPRNLPLIPECPEGGAYLYDRNAGTVSCPNGHRDER
ncbi:hypothetical protein JXA88_18955 [Candidatus Fermentibacteria bacterium]|nr:hypothetical protein [Candidatus Fermentibacteria bacterium]